MNNVHLAVSLLLTPPAMKQPMDIRPYVSAFAALLRYGWGMCELTCVISHPSQHRSQRLTLALPPAPRLLSAVQMPGSQKATKPTITI
jgi:precorrin-6B methylase 1